MKITKIEEVDGRDETKGCEKAASEIIKKLKEIWMSESLTDLDYVIVKKGGDIILGGDHSISYKSFRDSGCDGLLILDAHPDVYHEFDESTHLDWLKFLVDEKKVLPEIYKFSFPNFVSDLGLEQLNGFENLNKQRLIKAKYYYKILEKDKNIEAPLIGKNEKGRSK